jgi:hypothetical protein
MSMIGARRTATTRINALKKMDRSSSKQIVMAKTILLCSRADVKRKLRHPPGLFRMFDELVCLAISQAAIRVAQPGKLAGAGLTELQ